MKTNKLDLFLYITTLLSFVAAVWYSVGSYSLKAENERLRRILASQTCDNLVIVIPGEELRQCGYQDGDIFLKISKEK